MWDERVHVSIATRHAEEPTMTRTTRPTSELPATRNQDWGFWGTLGEQAPAAWPLAMTRVAEATGEEAVEEQNV